MPLRNLNTIDRAQKQSLKKARRVTRRKLRFELLEERRVMVGEIVELSYQFYALNPDGSTGRNLDPTPSDSRYEAFVGLGERFVVRTLAKDLRPTPQGVFSVYSDFNYTNADGSSAEKMQVQWGEHNVITIGNGALAGTFQLKYGTNTSASIAIGLFETQPGTFMIDPKRTASNIQSALENMANIGIGNAIVKTFSSGNESSSTYRVFFRNALARTDFPNPEIVNNQVNTGGSSPIPISITATGVDNPSPTTSLVLQAAINESPIPNQGLSYLNGVNGVLSDQTATVPGKRSLVGVGGFADHSSPSAATVRKLLAANDKIFIATEAGVINLAESVTFNPNPNQGFGIAVFGSNFFVPANLLILPTGTVTISDRIAAVSDSITVGEDIGTVSVNVLANDVDRFGTSRSVVALTQPASGGSVTIVNNGANVEFTPATNFYGKTFFTYTVRNNFGDEAVGLVNVTVSPANDVPTLNAINNITLPRNASSQNISLTGISAGPGESQVIRVTATSSNTSLIPHPSVSYTSPNGTGVLSFAPVADKFGTATVVVTVTDDGVPPLQTTRTFEVTVTPPAGGYRNPSNAYDVNGDAFVSPIDVLININLLNSKGPTTPVVGLPGPAPFSDVDGDDLVTPLDVLKVADYLNFGGPFSGTESGMAQLSYGFFTLVGESLDPNPNDTNLEAIVAPGEKFIVRTYVKDLRPSPHGVFSVYSDFNYTNADGSAATKLVFDRTTSAAKFGNAASGKLVDFTATTPGKRTLQQIGSFTNSVNFPADLAGSFLPVYDTLFTAQGQGVVQVSQSLSSQTSEKLGISMFMSNGNYLPADKVVMPSATITIRDPLIAMSDSFSISEDTGPTSFNVVANDFDRFGTSRGVSAVTQPAEGGVVSFVNNSSTIDFVPATNFFGRAIFTYTLSNNLGNQSVGTVTIDVTPVNDAPTLNSITNVTIDRNAPSQTVNLTGISAGPGETGVVSISVGSSNIGLIPNPTLNYTSPNATGTISFTPVADKFGASEIFVTVEDEAGIRTTRVFTFIVNSPARGYQNPNNPLDVNNNGQVNPVDYLIVRNLLDSKAASTSVIGLPGPPDYFDVDGDDLVTPLDTLKLADQLSNSPSTSSPPVVAQITYGFFAKDGRNLDPNPSDDKPEAIIGLGEQFIVRTYVRDLRSDPRGVFSAYSDFNYTNSDGSAAAKIVFESTSSSADYSEAPFGKLVDMTGTTAGKRVLQKVGRYSNRIALPSEAAGTTLAAYDTLFTARELGVIQVVQTIPSLENERLGITMLGGSGQFLNSSQVLLPSATITVKEGLAPSFPMTNWVSFTAPTQSSFVAETSKPGFVDAWIDFNQDGDWDDPDDRVANKVEVGTGWNIVPFTIPKSAGFGERNARFRLSKAGGLTPNGTLAEGDVNKDLKVVLEGGSFSSPSLYVDQLGAHEVAISNGLVSVKAGSKTLWSVPANELTRLTSVNKNGTVVSELRDFSSAFPGAVRYNEATSTVELKVATTNLDLSTYGTDNLKGVQTIDLRQSGSNVLKLDVKDVEQINSQRKLQVAMNADDSLATTNNWVVQPGRVENGAWIQSYTSLDADTKVERTLEIVSARPWRNEVSRLDADADRTISPLDVLVLINGINANIFPGNTLPSRQTSSPKGFYDIDGDNSLSPLDVLQVINRINSGTANRGSGEGEQAATVDLVFAASAVYSDAEEWWTREQSRTTSRTARANRK